MSGGELEPLRVVMRTSERQLREAHELLRWIYSKSQPRPSYETMVRIETLLRDHTGRVE